MSHYTNYRKMDIEAAETGPEPIPTSVSHKIINKMEANGVVYFLVQWGDSFMGPSWVIESSEPWLQKLIQEYEGGLPESPQGNMDIQQCDNLKQVSKNKPEEETTQGKRESRRLRPEQYQRLGNSQVKTIVDKFISKIKRAIFKLKNAPSKNLYISVTKIICLYNANQELGLIVQYNGTDFYKCIPYDEMRENHPRELQVFLGKCLQEYNNMCLGIFAKNYRMHADFLGKLFDNSWIKDPSGLMVKTPKKLPQGKKQRRFDSEVAANIFSVEFQVDGVGNELRLMMDESEEPESRDYEWGV